MRQFTVLASANLLLTAIALAASGDVGEWLGLSDLLRQSLAVAAALGVVSLLCLLLMLSVVAGLHWVLLHRSEASAVSDAALDIEEPRTEVATETLTPAALSSVLSDLRARGYRAEIIESTDHDQGSSGLRVSDIVAGLDVSQPDRR